MNQRDIETMKISRRSKSMRTRLRSSCPALVCALSSIRLVFLLLLCGLPTLQGIKGMAQVASGTITGHITDKSGALLVAANVTLTKTDTGLILHSKTNGKGVYAFASLQTGPYHVEAEAQGFRTSAAITDLTVGQISQIDLSLEVGKSTETVTVESSGAAQLDGTTSSLGYIVGSEQVADLPLNGRNPYGLAALSPGIVPGANFGAGVSTARGAVVAAASNNFQSNGGIAGSNEVLLDGVSIVVCCQGQPSVTPSVEVVDQFKVLTSNPPASFGRSSGGILNIVTKSGTNTLHGTVYEYFRNDKLDAANFFTKRSGVYPIPGHADYRLPHKFNQFGGFVGGPVRIPHLYNGKDRTFFTFGYEGTRNVATAYQVVTVPTALMRQGIFTEAPALVYSPNNVAPDAANPGQYIRQPIPAACNGSTCYPAGRYIPSINIVAQNYLKLFPAPLNTSVSNNYSYGQGITDTENQYNFRVDHTFSNSQRLFVRGTRDANINHRNDLFNQKIGANSVEQALKAYLFALGDSWIVSPNLIFQATYGFSYQSNKSITGNFALKAGDYGYSSQFQSQQQIPGLPFVSINGLQSLGGTNVGALSHYTHSLGVTATLQRGNHTITGGYDGRIILENNAGIANANGQFSFSSAFTSGPNPSGSLPSGQDPFDSFASFLLGSPSSGSLQRQLTFALRQNYSALFVQDDYRLSRKLTLNLGVRYDIESGFKERSNHWADFDPSAANPLALQTGLTFTGGAQFLGSGSNPSRTWKTNYGNVAPRIGLAYAATPTIVVRGGYGILYLPTSERIANISPIGLTQSTTYLGSIDGRTPANSVTNPFPDGVILPAGPSVGLLAGAGTSINTLSFNNPTSYEQQWNFGVQQSLGSGIIFNTNYAGSHGVKLPINTHPNDLNPAYFGAPGDQAQVAFLNASVPNPFFGKISTGPLSAKTVQRVQLLAKYPQYSSVQNTYDDVGSVTYNALQVSLVTSRKNGLTGSVAYTWSKLLGNAADIATGFLNPQGSPGYQNYYLIHQYERSNQPNDVPHRVVANFAYQLPFGKGQYFGRDTSRLVDLAIGGWSVTGIVSVQSGFPLGMTQSGGQNYSGRPFFVPGVAPLTSGSIHDRIGGVGKSQGYFNPAAFRLGKSFEFGGIPRNSALLRSPVGFQNDFSLLKAFPVTETVHLQFRLEAFNLLNKVQFGFPNTNFNSGSAFGRITSQANLPRNVQAALKLSF